MLRSAGALAAVLLITSVPAAAQRDDVSGFVGLGAAFAPDYLGSDDYEARPFGAFRAAWRGYSLQTEGLGLAADLVPARAIDAGPLVRWLPGRDDVEDPAVDALPEIDDAIEVGGYVRLNARGFGARDVASLRAAIVWDAAGAYDGATVDLSASYDIGFAGGWRAGLSLGTTIIGDDYAGTYFGVTPAGALASGLPVHAPEGGVRDVSLSANLTIPVADDWFVTTRAGWTRLLGDAADSPIVAERGSEDQLFIGAALGWRF